MSRLFAHKFRVNDSGLRLFCGHIKQGNYTSGRKSREELIKVFITSRIK